MMTPFVLDARERALVDPALQRAARHEALQREAMAEVGRLLAMRTGLPPERIRFRIDTYSVEEVTPGQGGIAP